MTVKNISSAVTPTDFRAQLVFRPIMFGALGAGLLQGIYLIIISLLNTPEYAWNQFVFLAPWMLALEIGFGVQVGIFFYMRTFAKLAKKGSIGRGQVAATAGISSGSMLACCLHHVVDILPFIGISAVAVFLTQFQTFLLSVGIVSNVVGLSFILYSIKKHNLYLEGGLISKVVQFDMKKVFYLTLALGIVFLAITFLSQL